MPITPVIRFSPARIVLFSFLGIIAVGTYLLSLSMAQVTPISLLDAFFTAASATCVTGLSVVPISSFTLFGKCVILALIQIGGLGLITLSFIFASMFLNLGILSRALVGRLLEFEVWGKVKQFLALIIGVTAMAETLGTIFLYFEFKNITHVNSPFFLALFHSVSAFCSAGISLFDTPIPLKIVTPTFMGIMSLLMFAGGIGFIVWYDMAQIVLTWLRSLRGDRKIFRVSLHTKITVVSTLLLTIIGGFLVWSIERNFTLKTLSPISSFVHATFIAMSARGVGFLIIPLGMASLATLFLFLILMFIGASPGSTGAGVKTTTFVIFTAAVLSIVRNREGVEISGRRIPPDQVYKVMAIVTLGMFWICATTFILLILEQGFSFFSLMFEAVSAFGNCGLSMGITSMLQANSKLLLILTMLIGRVGALTLVLALRKPQERYLYQYPEERVMIG